MFALAWPANRGAHYREKDTVTIVEERSRFFATVTIAHLRYLLLV